MGENSAIEWCDHTFNPVWGCSKVSPGCDHCYAEAFDHRLGWNHWGVDAPFREFPGKYWDQPFKWNSIARHEGRRARVFCASMADVFDKRWPGAVRPRLWDVIRKTPNLDWLLLTKRIGNAADMLPADWERGYPNVWLGASIVNQEEADRDIPKLLATPAAVHFLSCEPLLGPIDLGCTPRPATLPVPIGDIADGIDPLRYVNGHIDWVIAGGESGAKARPMHPAWPRLLRDQCAAAGVPFFFKQWGEWIPFKPVPGGDLGGDVRRGHVDLVHPTGEIDVEVSERTGGHSVIPGSRYMARVGKKDAGAWLDGREHRAFPQPVAARA